MKTYMAKTGEVEQKWYVLDARDWVLGRMAAKIATMLQGKNKPTYTPHMDTGDFIVVTHAEKVQITGNKVENKVIRYHSGYIGGLKEISLKRYLKSKPEEVVRLAVRRMLPKTKLGRQMIKKLKIYKGGEHRHHAQQPVPLAAESAE